ncbi:MAG: hypothetical protein V9G11_08335 [Bifidobacterium adolescentis]
MRREFHGFAELPFGDVDSLVLAELSYMRLSGSGSGVRRGEVGGDGADSRAAACRKL